MLLLFVFSQQILNYSTSAAGKEFVNRLSNITIQSTLFVPDNDGLFSNQVTPTSTFYTLFLLPFVWIQSKMLFHIYSHINPWLAVQILKVFELIFYREKYLVWYYKDSLLLSELNNWILYCQYAKACY